MQHTITNNVSLGYNLGVEFEGYDDPVLIYTFAPGISLSDKWYAYLEAFGTLVERPEHSLAGGLAFYVSDNFKLDLSGGFGISSAAPKHYISLGASVRFKTGK